MNGYNTADSTVKERRSKLVVKQYRVTRRSVVVGGAHLAQCCCVRWRTVWCVHSAVTRRMKSPARRPLDHQQPESHRRPLVLHCDSKQQIIHSAWFGLGVGFTVAPWRPPAKLLPPKWPIENAIISDWRWQIFKGYVSRFFPMEKSPDTYFDVDGVGIYTPLHETRCRRDFTWNRPIHYRHQLTTIIPTTRNTFWQT